MRTSSRMGCAFETCSIPSKTTQAYPALPRSCTRTTFQCIAHHTRGQRSETPRRRRICHQASQRQQQPTRHSLQAPCRISPIRKLWPKPGPALPVRALASTRAQLRHAAPRLSDTRPSLPWTVGRSSGSLRTRACCGGRGILGAHVGISCSSPSTACRQ